MEVWNKRTTKEIKKIVNNLEYVLLKDYISKRIRRVIIQDKEKYKYDINLSSLIKGHLPNIVHLHNPVIALENMSLWLRKEGKEFELCENNVYSGAKEKLWFHCLKENCGELFDMSWDMIHSQKCVCPYCSWQRVSDRNRLSIISPKVSLDWDYVLNEDTPNDVSWSSGKMRWWICPNGHESYPSIIANRAKGSGCPYCSGRMVSDNNRLSIVHPNAVNDWDYDKNEDAPYDVSYGSNEKRYWICHNGHESYLAAISHKSNGRGCPTCSDEQKESSIATELKQWCKDTFKYVDIEHRMFKNPKTKLWLKCDIYIGELESINGVYIEIHGQQHFEFRTYWHKTEKEFEDQKYRDKIKKEYAKKNGTYIEIDIRKIKNTDDAITYVKKILKINSKRIKQ